eukprot:g40003.t1
MLLAIFSQLPYVKDLTIAETPRDPWHQHHIYKLTPRFVERDLEVLVDTTLQRRVVTFLQPAEEVTTPGRASLVQAWTWLREIATVRRKVQPSHKKFNDLLYFAGETQPTMVPLPPKEAGLVPVGTQVEKEPHTSQFSSQDIPELVGVSPTVVTLSSAEVQAQE